MRRWLMVLVAATVFCTTTRAFGWNLKWINANDSCRGSQLWFVHSFTLPSRPHSAWIEAASNGRFVVYVNGYNITNDVLAPYPRQSASLRSVTCDVTPFIDDDSCRIAVWYSPFLDGYEGRQLSLTLYGTSADGTSFAFPADKNWAWTKADAMTYIGDDETENINANGFSPDWKTCNIPSPLLYPVDVRQDSCIVEPYKPQFIRHVYECRYAHSTATSLTFLSPCPFRGWVRVTLRGMRAGTTISVNGLNYTCSGIMDEQACRRFTIPRCQTSTIKILSPSGIKPDNVMSVEAIDIEE